MNFPNIFFPNAVERLEAQRIYLDEITIKDAEDYFKINSNKEVMRFWGTSPHNEIVETKALIDFLKNEFSKKQMIRWAIRLKNEDNIIGDIGFWRFVYPRARAEIGAKLLPNYWSKGIISEAMKLLIDYSFSSMNLNSIEGNIDPINVASIKLSEKMGFKFCGPIEGHSFCYLQEKFITTHLFSLTKENWQGRKYD